MFIEPTHSQDQFRRSAALSVKRNRARKVAVKAGWYTEEKMKNELMMSGLLGYRYLSFRSCDKFRDKFPRVVLQRLFELKGITINK